MSAVICILPSTTHHQAAAICIFSGFNNKSPGLSPRSRGGAEEEPGETVFSGPHRDHVSQTSSASKFTLMVDPEDPGLSRSPVLS